MFNQNSEKAPLIRTPRGAVGQPISANGDAETIATLWSQMDPGEPDQLVANLRAVGCPEQTIREIILLRVARKYRRRLVEADTAAARSCNCAKGLAREHWSKRQKLQNQLVNEMSAELESLVGADLDSLRQSVLMFPPCGVDRTGFLPAAQRRKVHEVEARYQELKQELTISGMMGLLDAEDRAELRRLELERRAELAKILSPGELEEYLYRSSAAAGYVRNHMPAAKSELEFRQMVQVALDMDMIDEPVSFAQRYGLPGPEDPGAKEVEARKAAFEERVKQVLGEERVAEQKAEEQKRLAEEQQRRELQNRERERARIVGIAASVGVSAEAAARFLDRLDELKPELEAKFNEIQKRLTGTREEKHTQMRTAMFAELEKVARGTIGEEGRRLVEKIWAEEQGQDAARPPPS